MIKEYKIRKINNSGTVIEVLDKTFNSPGEAYRYMCNNPLDGEGKYFMRQIFGVSYMEENNLDDFRFEEYPNIKYEKEIKNFKGEPSKYPPLPSAEQIAEYEKRESKDSEKALVYDFNDAMKSIAKSVESLRKTKWGESVNKEEYDLTDDGTGKKYDTGKPMVGALCRVFPRALMAIGACIEFGTHKYPKPDNWKMVEGAYTRYQDSMVRHYLKHLQDQVFDDETGKLHLAHLCWNALAITELYLMEHPELMEELNK